MIDFNFEPFLNYEAIICSYFPNSEEVNAACMGVHFSPQNEIFIHAYENTQTRKNLQPNIQFSVNFAEDFYDYALAALQPNKQGVIVSKIPKKRYHTLTPVPILASDWGVVTCQVIEWNPKLIPVCKRVQAPNIRAKILNKEIFRLPKYINNRSFSLALEALIITTRIPIYDRISKEYREAIQTFKSIKKKIEAWRDMDRFDKAFQLMDNYLLESGLKGQDVFDF